MHAIKQTLLNFILKTGGFELENKSTFAKFVDQAGYA